MRSNAAVCEIVLSNGAVSLVDECDFELAKRYKWNPLKTTSGVYATRRPNEACPHRSLHRLIMNARPGQIVDHIDSNPLNNTRQNLRFVTVQQNAFNRRKRRDSSSRYKGVNFCKVSKKWGAIIGINGRITRLGMYKTDKDAALAHDIVAFELRGEHAKTNFTIKQILSKVNAKKFKHLFERIAEFVAV